MGKIMHGNQVYSGGGGSTVVANPSGTATADLAKLEVEGYIYNIPSGGGGSVDDVQVDNNSVVDQNGIAHINTMTGAGSGSAGAKGLVPAPASGDSGKFLKGDGTWDTPSGGGTGSILYGTATPTSQIGSDGDVYYQYETSQGGEWTADSEYLVSTANSEFAYDENRHWIKTYAGKAIAVYLSGTWSGGMLVSQDQDACKYSNEGGTVNTVQSTVIDGETWYSSTPGAWLNRVLQNTDGVAPTVSYNYSTQNPSTASVIIPFILQTANMRHEQSASSIIAVYFKKDGVWLPDTRYLAELGDTTITSPVDGQVLKYNATTQKWENSNGGGGASAVSDLTDVSLSNLANGQILKYNATSQKWENANESGGGGGGGGSYSETTLFTGTYQSYSGEITLNDNLDNYDQIIIYARWASTSTNGCTPFLIERAYLTSHFPYDNGSTAQTSNHLVLCPYQNQYIRVKCGSANNKLFLYDAHSIAIERVAGLKYGGGGSSSGYSRTELFKSSTDWGVWDSSVTLSDDIENYDEIEFVLAFSASDKSKRTNKFGAKWFADNCAYTSAAAGSDHALLLLWPNQGFSAAWDSANSKIMMWGRNGSAGMFAVYGIKY